MNTQPADCDRSGARTPWMHRENRSVLQGRRVSAEVWTHSAPEKTWIFRPCWPEEVANRCTTL